jgi:hypothetical protein
MAVDGDFANFRAVYDELTDEVNRARYQFLPDHIANWFKTLDTTPRVSAIIKRLESGVDYRPWRHELARSVRNVHIEWPKEPDQALGMKLSLFRNFTKEGPDDVATFGFSFLRSGTNVNDNARGVIEQIFMPMARELRRYLERELSEIPAADRIVSLDHNSAAYKDAMDALETLENVLRGANDYPDPDEKERIVAEVSATRRVLQSAKVRIGVVVSLLATPALYLVKTFAGTAVGDAANKVIELITPLLGAIF